MINTYQSAAATETSALPLSGRQADHDEPAAPAGRDVGS